MITQVLKKKKKGILWNVFKFFIDKEWESVSRIHFIFINEKKNYIPFHFSFCAPRKTSLNFRPNEYVGMASYNGISVIILQVFFGVYHEKNIEQDWGK